MQFDVQTAFLYGDLEEDIYMELSDGFESENKEDCKKASVVCKLLKPLYGLKQSLHRQNKKLSVLKQFNFKEIEADKNIFIDYIRNCKVILALFLNDGFLAAK